VPDDPAVVTGDRPVTVTSGRAPVSLAAGTRQVTRALGPDVVRALHRQNAVADVATFVVMWATAVALAIGLGHLPLRLDGLGALWVGAFVLQGFVLQLFGIYAHDAFLHRQFGGRRLSDALGLLCFVPITSTYTDYRHLHLVHHRFVNSDGDSEVYKQDFDRRWVKVMLLTVIGVKLSWSGRFRRGDRPIWTPSYSPEERQRLRRELAGLALWAGGIIALAFLDWRTVVFGYLLPLAVMAPIASTLRVILEHADVDRTEPLHNATFYRTGWISGPLFLFGSGDCHLVHHLFPAIPFYRMRRATLLIRPILRDAGVPEHRSLARLVKLWFIDNRAHGTDWSRPRSAEA
jgi:fatty acid desaturase